MEKKRGRPTRKTYAGTYLTLELLETVSAVYAEKQEIKATALALELPPHKVKKLLITHGTFATSKQIRLSECSGRACASLRLQSGWA